MLSYTYLICTNLKGVTVLLSSTDLLWFKGVKCINYGINLCNRVLKSVAATAAAVE